jgi:hypothetical protein
MKRFSLVVAGLLTVALFVVVAGCKSRQSSTAEGDGGKKLTLKAPADTSIKQGETAIIAVDITREKFNDPVELKFVDMPQGVSIVESNLTLAKDVTSAKFTLKVAADAKLVEDHKVTVQATSAGMKPEATFKVTIKKGADTCKRLTLKVPTDASVIQGETVAINVIITREMFSDAVELKFTGLPEGVTIMEKDLTLSKDNTNLKVNLKAAADAKVVEAHQVTVTASGGGMTQEAAFKMTVKKKS